MPQVAPGSTLTVIEEAARAIDAEFAVAMGSERRVAQACDALRTTRDGWYADPALARLEQLASLIAGQATPLVPPLFGVLEEVMRGSPRPWRLLEPMLRVGAPELVERALDELLRAVDARRLQADGALLASLATIAEAPVSALAASSLLLKIARVFGDNARSEYLSSPNPATRRLAARVLDLAGRPPDQTVCTRVLGASLARLSPYLEYTRATHVDLLLIADAAGGEPPVLPSLCAVEAAHGMPLLRQVIASLGWAGVNRGIEATPFVGVSIGGGIPLLLTPDEAALFERCPGAERMFERTLFVAHGARPAVPGGPEGDDGRVTRFRASNLAHARLLAEFLDLAPLTLDRVARLAEEVGALVDDFTALFPGEREECRHVRAAYEALRSKIVDAVAGQRGTLAAPEVARLVQPFEDPASADQIRSLHGLKRYLHQRGLRLGFTLVQSGRHATRTVSLVVASNDRVIHAVRPIEYADFEPGPSAELPYPVRVVAEGFATQLLHGEEKLPSVRVFCYGNEVHYFLSFRNHPAFVRVDYSPPFAGGMIDLEYYGVSKYELSQHPDVSLDGIRACFARLDFDVTVENTRIHARYDKERASDLSDLCARGEALFRLAPYLMDIDWALGSLDLSRDARTIAARAWADRVARWGVLPLSQMLTPDRCGIRQRDEPHPAGPRMRAWRGDPPYRDRLTAEPPAGFGVWLRDTLRARGVDTPLVLADGELTQLAFVGDVRVPLRDSSRPPDTPHAERVHEARVFGELLLDGGTLLVEAGRVARVIAPLERFLPFETTGAINGHEVQRARLPLRGRALSLFVLRDDTGASCAACFTARSAIWRDVRAKGARSLGVSHDAGALVAVLRACHYPAGDPAAGGEVDAASLARALAVPGRHPTVRALDGERMARGVRAAPGAATGLARFGSARRAARDVEGAIFVTDRLSPDDGPFLVRAAGVVCTGGGVLSHAGLLAAQFAKPALLIDARWDARAGAASLLSFSSVEYDEVEDTLGPYTVVERRGFRRREECVRDGDLLDLNADERAMRVLGQDRETLALHDALGELSASDARLATAAAPEEILIERGRRLHAAHQLERLLARVARPDLAAHAVRQLLASGVPPAGRAALLRIMLDGPVAEVVRRCVHDRVEQLDSARRSAEREARERTPAAVDPFEVLALRLAERAAAEALEAARAVLPPGPLSDSPADRRRARDRPRTPGQDESAFRRLRELHDETLRDVSRALAADDLPRVRHLLDAVQRDGAILGADTAAHASLCAAARDRLHDRDRAVLSACVGRRILTAADGGAELAPLIGGKAANLAEIARLDGDVSVPPWFAVTDAAFREALAVAVPGRNQQSVASAVDEVLSRPGADDHQRARAIAEIWEDLTLPAALEREVREAYRHLSVVALEDSDAPVNANRALLVAVRSSAREEDTSTATRAGEFETFLFVGGADALIAYLKRAWSGLWTARAISRRAMLGGDGRTPGGGILVQRSIDARAAGVIQTINVADRRPREMSVDAACGLGQGVVSGLVAADHVTVVKRDDPQAPLRFRYATADKRERVVYDAGRGTGTVRADTLYHQRMRPALEYAELEDLVSIAARLERGWREALDIEFAIDARRLWILQARPIPSYHAAWRETTRRYPFASRRLHP